MTEKEWLLMLAMWVVLWLPLTAWVIGKFGLWKTERMYLAYFFGFLPVIPIFYFGL